MKEWWCPGCGATRKYLGIIIIKVCIKCGKEFEVREYE